VLTGRSNGRRGTWLAASASLAAALSLVGAPSGSHAPDDAAAAPAPGSVRLAQVLDAESTGVASPVGLAFSPVRDSLYVLGAPGAASAATTSIVKLTPFAPSALSERAGSSQLAAAVQSPINVAFDPRGKRLLVLGSSGQLLDVRTGVAGDLNAGAPVRHDASRFLLKNPQGLAVDPASGAVFVLDAGNGRILRIATEVDGTFDAAAVSAIDLARRGLTGTRGIAFDPATGHLHVGSGHELYELTTSGDVVAVRDLSEFGLVSPQGLVFAPSGDSTDDPAEQSLYIADSGSSKSSGQIVELTTSAAVSVAAIDFQASVVHTIDTSLWSPPSPDPSGLTYRPASNTLVMVDGEVEETVNGITHFQGKNVWELTLTGTVVRTANVSKIAPTVVPMTNEPVGVAFNPNNGHYFVSDDVAKKVFDLNPGADNLIGTADDTFTWWSTTGPGNGDPEGITYDPVGNRIWVADGVDREVYEWTPSGTFVGQFDTAKHGVEDPETVEYNAINNSLFVLSNRQSGPIIIETTTSGSLIRTIGVPSAGVKKPAGLAYAPASDGSGVKHFYFVDRGVDNDSDPNAVDGKIFELTAPLTGNAPPLAVNDAYSTPPDTQLNVVTPGVLANDNDPNNDAMTATKTADPTHGSVTLNANGSFTYTPDTGFTGTDTFEYTASDASTTSNEATVTITVSAGGGTTTTTVNPVDDAYVRSGNPTQNNGSATTLRVYTTNQESYLKFVVPALGGGVNQAKLRLFVTQASTVGGTLFPVDDDSWSESTIIWNNKPAAGSPSLGSLGSVTLNQWVERDITSAITGAGTYSFVLKTGNSTAAWYSSSEGANPPQLVITSGGPPPPNTPPTAADNSYTTPQNTALVVSAPGVLGNDDDADNDPLTAIKTSDPASGTLNLNANGSFTYTPVTGFTGQVSFTYRASDGTDESSDATVTINVAAGGGGGTTTVTPSKDSYVRSAFPTENNGNSTNLRSYTSSGKETRTYISFTVSGLSGTVTSATLRLFVTDASPAGGALYAVADSSWTETGLTWDNKPALGALITNVGNAALSTWVELNVASVVTGNGTYSFAIGGVSSDVVYYSSKEGTNPPQLVVVAA
jgi:VCBS repeat-containing protein